MVLRSNHLDSDPDSEFEDDQDFNDRNENSEDELSNYEPNSSDEETELEDENGDEEMNFNDDQNRNNNDDLNDNNQSIDKDGNNWSFIPIMGRYSSSNVIRQSSGPTVRAINSTNETASSFLKLILDDELIDSICFYSNKFAADNNINLNLNRDLFNKFIGLLIARSVLIPEKFSIHLLWSKKYGNKLFQETMSRSTFYLILKCLRMDDKSTRDQRIEAGDKTAAISEYWDKLIKNSQQYYKPSYRLTIDESLAGCKAKCKFIQYIPSKRDKFGLKFYLLVDCENNYVLNGLLYSGKLIKFKFELLFINLNFRKRFK